MDHPSRSTRLLPLLRPRSGSTLVSRIQVTIERSIALGLFPEGRLPSERRLAQTLDVSRTALRSALELVRQSGYTEQSLIGRAGGAPTSAANRLTPEELAAKADEAMADIGNLLRVRRFLEPAFARAAAEERSPERIGRLIETQEQLARNPDQVTHRMSDGEFHYELAAVAGTDELLGCILRARADLMRWRDRFPMEDTVGHTAIEHWAVIEAIDAGEPDRAESAMRTHLDNSESLFLLFLGRYVDDPLTVLAEGQAAVARSLDLDLDPDHPGPLDRLASPLARRNCS